MLEHILFAVLLAAAVAAGIFVWWFEDHDSNEEK